MRTIGCLGLPRQRVMYMILQPTMLLVVLWKALMELSLHMVLQVVERLTPCIQGDQRSPGIIPLAVKDAFSIIQETPSREFLLRVSYLEIYNEVINDLLNPAGQNLRIREDSQGTFVEGVKEEVVLSPAHALSLIAAGEEHRHVGSTNFNVLSSRSHTIFTLTIESSPCGDGGDVNLSQLNLIDLAGSESSKAETTGVRRKEGSYINKSLLTLGTVISKLTDVKASHISYRDSKLTRLLQSSLSGRGRVSLICTVTPSSSNTEETHNTLKFAHRAKHIEIQAAQNRIIDEKSLIKKYQNEIRLLKEELEQLKSGIVVVPQYEDNGGDDIFLLKQKLEDGQMKLQSRLEQEEEAKAALLSRIQRLTKLILVSTKSSPASRLSHRSTIRRRHSFGEEELAYLPHRKRDLILDDKNTELRVSVDESVENSNDVFKEEKKTNKKPGLLSWLKPRRRDSISGALTSTSDKSSGAKSISTPSTPQKDSLVESRHSVSLPTECRSAEFSPGAPQHKQINGGAFLQQESPLTSIKTIDQIDLLKEQQKILSEEMAVHLSALKRLSHDASRESEREFVNVEIARLNEQIKLKNDQIKQLEDAFTSSVVSSHHNNDGVEQTRSVSELEAQLNEKSFELEVKAGDNRVLQEQLNQKINDCERLQETINSLKQQLSDARREFEAEKDAKIMLLRQSQAHEVEKLKVTELTNSRNQLETENKKLAEESSYAKGLASAAAVELKALSEEVSKLMSHNDQLSAELASHKNSPSHHRRSPGPTKNGRKDNTYIRHKEPSPTQSELKRELALSREREMAYEAMLSEKERIESGLQKTVEESKQREAYLENELASMWVLVAKLKKSNGVKPDETESSRGAGTGGDGFGMWNGIGQTDDLV
ncbi:kinesin-like protein KIN-7K, chloroplastic isoform X2 [Bidens hawaiensis]|uniref:kinesin-like protein KIN-7K, chloroplastic isoform X2 n=1 Tax=Bidens hawaiensis TaxID=980011 RepID=UPI0040490971